ncbi:MAG TPA: hypothetical protein VNV66_05785, partial [Pilimelia sp.]|nr:hypothetical protein [Pilimelia sp.]
MAYVADAGGGGRAGTNFFAYDVPGMWRLVENQDTDAHWQHVGGLTKIYDLCLYHLSTLRRYRGALAEAWPPERSPASRAYLDRLDHLIDHVQQTYEITTNNHKVFSAATGALSSARYELKKIYDEYVANQQRLDAYHAEQARNASAQPSPTPSPTPQPRPAPGPPPVAPGRQEELNNRARALMYRLSDELHEARTRLKHPPPYELKSGVGKDSGTEYSGGSTLGTPPYIPPIAPAPEPGARTASRG